jgi:Transcriptional regulator, AbiEi antitoxin
MSDDALESELSQVTAELAAARTEYASLGARIAGLQARHAALSRAVSGAGQLSRPSAGAAPGYRTDAIVAILDAAGTEMSISDVVTALRQAGRSHETYDNVGVDLAYLAERGRIARVRRGIYAPASS